MNNPDQVAFGQLGSKFVSDTNQVSIPDGKTIVAVTAIAAVTFDNTGADEAKKTISESGFEHPSTIPEGVTIFGRIRKMKLTSGKALVYFG